MSRRSRSRCNSGCSAASRPGTKAWRIYNTCKGHKGASIKWVQNVWPSANSDGRQGAFLWAFKFRLARAQKAPQRWLLCKFGKEILSITLQGLSHSPLTISTSITFCHPLVVLCIPVKMRHPVFTNETQRPFHEGRERSLCDLGIFGKDYIGKTHAQLKAACCSVWILQTRTKKSHNSKFSVVLFLPVLALNPPICPSVCLPCLPLCAFLW